MAECGISAGIPLDCTGKGQIGGLNRRVFIGNIKDLADSPYTVDVDGYITAIAFKTYGLLYEFIGQKYAHTAQDDIERNEGGSVNYPHTVTLKLFDDTPANKDVIEVMANSDVFVIVEDNNKNFVLYGADNGLTIETAPRSSGNAANSDTSRTITLTGNEPELAKIVLDTDYATTVAKLEGYTS